MMNNLECCIEHLWRSSESISGKGVGNTIVRSHLLSLCREIAVNEDLRLPEKLFGTHSVCQYCLNDWKLGCFTIRVLPRKIPGKRMKKIIQKHLSDKKSLNKHEQRLFERCQKDNTNKLSTLCLACHKKTEIFITRPVINLVKISSNEAFSECKDIQIPNKKKKKKKKKHDPYAGLNPSACTPVRTKSNKKVLETPSPLSVQKTNPMKPSVERVSAKLKNTPLNTKIFCNDTPRNTNQLQKILASRSKKQKSSALKAFLDFMT